MSKRTLAPQEKILSFIETYHTDHLRPPTVREIQREMGYKSPRAVSYFLEKMERDNLIVRKSRSRGVFLRKLFAAAKRKTFQIPFYEIIRDELKGEVIPEEKQLSVDVDALGLDPNGSYFALKMNGQDMVCAGIFEGDTVILEKREPQIGDIVAVEEENQTKFYRYAQGASGIVFKSENFHNPEEKPCLISEIKGVMVSLIRPVRQKKSV